MSSSRNNEVESCADFRRACLCSARGPGNMKALIYISHALSNSG